MASSVEELTAVEPEQTQVPVEAEKDPSLLAEEYRAKAEELENRIDRLEGRQSREEQLASWFVELDSDVNVQPILKKGMTTEGLLDLDIAILRH